MRMRFSVGMAALGLMALALPAKADIQITQYPSAAPNVFGSPSWTGYQTNALNSLQSGSGNIGDGSSPTDYLQLSGGYLPGMIEVTNYSSWLGTANPGGAFASELGNRLHFGAIITDTSGTFDLRDVSFNLSSSDSAIAGPGGSLAFSGDLAGANFSSGSRIGVKLDGSICDATHGSCNDTTQLKQLFYVGVGNAFDASLPSGSSVADEQAALDSTTSYIITHGLSVSNQYCVQGTCNSVTLDAIPEPAGSAAFVAGCLGLWRARSRTRRHVA